MSARSARAAKVREVLAAGGRLESSRCFPHERHFQLYRPDGTRVGDAWSEAQAAELVEDGVVSFAPRTPGEFDTLIARLTPEKAST